MIIVLGSVKLHADRFDEGLRLSLEHVARSREEPGCLAHAVHRGAEDSLELAFVERWADMAALQQHFRVPASRAFAKALAACASRPPGMSLYDANEVPVAL